MLLYSDEVASFLAMTRLINEKKCEDLWLIKLRTFSQNRIFAPQRN